MSPRINAGHMLSAEPSDIPGLVAYWNFDHSAESYTAVQGEAYTLSSQTGELTCVEEDGCKGIHIREGDYLVIPRSECPRLDIHGPQGHVTVLAWIKRAKSSKGQCEFIAGQWNETDGGRQYGLFLNINVWHTPETVCGHLSHVGGATPGYKYCMDGAFSKEPVPHDTWTSVGMSYDGQSGFAWRDGILDAQPMLNPYSMAGGLNDGGDNGSDFTVGAVHRSGEFGNFFSGIMAGLAVYDRALTPAEVAVLHRCHVASA